ncbi:MAG: hypothetical protein ABR875_03995 [Minisyncoccia bacterium]|jgi:hypothetical protein
MNVTLALDLAFATIAVAALRSVVGSFSGKRKFDWAGILCISAMFLLGYVRDNITEAGVPIFSIPQVGSYKVAYAYVAGENVNVGIEVKTGVGATEKIVNYQFLKSSVNGLIPEKPDHLNIMEFGNGQIGKYKNVQFSKPYPEVIIK